MTYKYLVKSSLSNEVLGNFEASEPVHCADTIRFFTGGIWRSLDVEKREIFPVGETSVLWVWDGEDDA